MLSYFPLESVPPPRLADSPSSSSPAPALTPLEKPAGSPSLSLASVPHCLGAWAFSAGVHPPPTLRNSEAAHLLLSFLCWYLGGTWEHVFSERLTESAVALLAEGEGFSSLIGAARAAFTGPAERRTAATRTRVLVGLVSSDSSEEVPSHLSSSSA